jgi:RNA polymerase sigma factor (sigma-70 family)
MDRDAASGASDSFLLREGSELTRAAFEEYQPVLHRYLLRRLKDANEARDLMHDVYMRFLQVSRQEKIQYPQALLFRLASNFVYELKVRGHRDRLVYDSDLARELAEAQSDTHADETGTRVNLAQQIEKHLAELPPALQAILLMRHRDGLSIQQIARQLGYSKDTVYSYLSDATAHFRRMPWDR